MKPRTHTKLVGLSPLVGVVTFFAGFGVLALSDASLSQFGVLTTASLLLIVGVWAATRWLVVVDCPDCGSPMKMKKGEETFVYECPRCPKLIDSGRKIVTVDDAPVIF